MSVVGYRVAAYHTPLWLEPNVGAGRFNRAGSIPVQYVALHPLAPWAEALRRVEARSLALELRLPIWALRVPDAPIVELGFDDAAGHGIDAYDLVCPPSGYGACQDLAERLYADAGAVVLRTPSAALPGTRNLVLLGERIAAGYLAEPLDPLDVPVAPTAGRSRLLDELWERRRPLGARAHAEYDAWRRGERYRFEEPATASLDR